MSNKIRLVTLFSGYDSQAMAMERVKQDFSIGYDLVAWCEIDRDAIKAHDAVFPQWKGRNLGDICEVNPEDVPDCDLITYSYPCTAISNAGKQEGMTEGSGTASSLVWECFKIFEAKRPKYLLMENVKALLQKKFEKDFSMVRKRLEELGYVNFFKVLNAKNFGVAQNRERVFMVSILRTEDDPEPHYEFPEGFPLDKTVEDYMQSIEEVGENYYIDRERITGKVLSDILDQPNVRAEFEKLYHQEAQEASTQMGGG